jgi:hypothetical protein
MLNPTRSGSSPAARARRNRRTAIIVIAAMLATFAIPVLALALG